MEEISKQDLRKKIERFRRIGRVSKHPIQETNWIQFPYDDWMKFVKELLGDEKK